jgi:hypothetical protein
MSYQVWLLASQYFISSLGVRRGIDNRPPNQSRLHPTLQHNGVRITIATDCIIVTLLTFLPKQVQQDCVLPHFCVRHLYPHRSSGVDGQVRIPCRSSSDS